MARLELSRLSRYPRIYLIGARGSGKTTVGKMLAGCLGYGFCDLDHYLCEREGTSIENIVAEEGWPAFRRLESDVLREAARSTNLVFATGGGVVLDGANRAFLVQTGRVAWLKAPAVVLAARLAKNPQSALRPALTEKGLLAEIGQVLQEREDLYARSCHYVIDAQGAVEEICERLLFALGIYEKGAF